MDYWEQLSRRKAGMVYDVIDNSGGFYKCPVEKPFRSNMNVCFKVDTPEIEKAFLAGCEKANLLGLEGHRSVGGMRASLYTGMTLEGTAALVEYMKEFAMTHSQQ